MRIRIIQGGQTGVDRGAWRGAIEAGLPRVGWMPHDMRDELGLIPDEVRADLKQHSGGLSARTSSNVRGSHAVICIVEDATRGIRSPGTRETWRLAKQDECAVIVIDGTDAQLARLAQWLHDLSELETFGRDVFDLMLAGPRASIWPEGEEVARRVVKRIAEVCK